MTSNPHDPLSIQGRMFFARPTPALLSLSESVLAETNEGGDWIFAAKELAKETLRINEAMKGI